MTARPEAFAIVCAALSLFARRRWSSHGPIAFAICLSAARDVAGAIVELPCRFDVAWLIAAVCASGWAYERTWEPLPGRFDGAKSSWPIWLFLAVLGAGVTSHVADEKLAAWTRDAALVPTFLAVLAGGWGLVASSVRNRPATVERDVATVLLAGDLGGLLSGFDPRTIGAHAILQLVVASLVHVAWLARPSKIAR